MNLLVMFLTIWRWGMSLSQTMIMKPAEISTSKILRTIKAQTITACWVECQQTTECETIGTDPEDKKTNGFVSNCYLFGSRENKTDASDETPLKVTEISPFPVSYLEFVYSVIYTFCFLCLILPDYFFVLF